MVLAHVVITLPQHPLLSRATRWFIPEKNLSVPNNIITPSHDLLISRHTCWFIQEKSFTAARIVASPAQQLVIPKITSVPIQEKNRFIVINATIQAPWHIWNDTNSSTSEKLFSCSQCSFSCSRDGNLKDHIRIHSGEKPFKCNLCNYSSTRASHVKERKCTHTGEKRFKCDQWSV